ncbi:MAG: hypothetical protein ACOCV1_04030 [Bacillota bacterium]
MVTFIIRPCQNKTILFLMILILSFSSICTIINGRFSVAHTIVLLANFSIALYLLNYGVNLKLLKLTFWGICLFLLAKLFSGVNPNYMFIQASRNWVSMLLIPIVSLLYYFNYEKRRKIPLLPIIIVLILSIWARGRSGILSAGILFFGIIYQKFQDTKLKKIFITLFILTITSFLLYPLINEKVVESYNLISFFNKFQQQGLSDSYRSKLIQEYINNLNNIKNFLFGYNYTYNELFISWKLNPHNSFIRMHSYLGLASILFILIVFYVLIYYFMSNKLYFFILLAFTFRAFTDNFLFVGPLDFIYFFIVFSGIKNLKLNSSTIKTNCAA